MGAHPFSKSEEDVVRGKKPTNSFEEIALTVEDCEGTQPEIYRHLSST